MKNYIHFIFTLFLSFGLCVQNVMVFQPSGGNNDGTDQGGLQNGKDTYANRYTPNTNDGANIYMAGSPRSNCNTSDYKSYYQFDVTGLPTQVDSVFFGVTHIPHTTYCYSNCTADFYFYYITSAWDEMALTQLNAPTEDTSAFFGPLTISFPNDYQNQEYDITNAYHAWASGNRANFGFTVYSPTVGCNNAAVTFGTHTSDDTAVAMRPYLKIYYPSQASIIEDEFEIRAYPNPFTDHLTIEIAGLDNYHFADLTGRRFMLPYNEMEGAFNTASLPSGIYFLYVEKGNKWKALKLIKN